jgi:antitoxin FitA
LPNTPSARRTWFEDRSDKTRILTMLYNEKPTWLRDARRKLDVALFHAYGWDPGMDDKPLRDELLTPNLCNSRLTCCAHAAYPFDMPKMIQLRHVPDDLHRLLKARAALHGLPLSEYLIREARRLAERPTLEDVRRRIAERTAVKPRTSPAKAVRAERERR